MNKNSKLKTNSKYLSPFSKLKRIRDYWYWYTLKIFIEELLVCKNKEKKNVILRIHEGENLKDVKLLKQIENFAKKQGENIWKVLKVKKNKFPSKENLSPEIRKKALKDSGLFYGIRHGGGELIFETILEDGKKLFPLLETYIDKISEHPFVLKKQKQIIGKKLFKNYKESRDYKEYQNKTFPFSTKDFIKYYTPSEAYREPFKVWTDDFENVQPFQVLQCFEREGLIKIKDYQIHIPLPFRWGIQENLDPYEIDFYLEITNKGIKELVKYREIKVKEKGNISKKEKFGKKTSLYINQNGDLYRKPKHKYCYPMSEKSNRYKIINFLTNNMGYQPTRFISTELSIENEKTLRTEIGKIRNNVEKYLRIDGKDFLQGKKESGYRINPKYKIIPKNE